MGKQAKKNEDREKAERKLKRARAKFEAMREEYLLVRERGKQQVERAQLEADRKLTKVNERLEKRAHAVSRAEERLLAGGTERGPAATPGVSPVANGALTTPEGAADAIAHVQNQLAQESVSPIFLGDQ